MALDVIAVYQPPWTHSAWTAVAEAIQGAEGSVC